MMTNIPKLERHSIGGEMVDNLFLHFPCEFELWERLFAQGGITDMMFILLEGLRKSSKELALQILWIILA